MEKKIRRISIVAILVIVVALTAGVALYSENGVTCIVRSEGPVPPVYDLSTIPQSVADDAARLANQLCGDSQEKCDDLTSQLLAIYSVVKDEDFAIIFNPGGLGWTFKQDISGWPSILTGIESELSDLDYNSLLLNHLRTKEGWLCCLDELVERIGGYRSKAKDLACRVEFITSHLPDLKVIIAGESTGSVICDRVMNILADNPQVYSIQTGPPFWYENIMLDRTLVMTNNGIIPDSYSRGDFFALIWGNLKHRLGLSPPVDDFDTPPHYIGAPGHDYWWQYPEVSSQITDFLNENFGIN